MWGFAYGTKNENTSKWDRLKTSTTSSHPVEKTIPIRQGVVKRMNTTESDTQCSRLRSQKNNPVGNAVNDTLRSNVQTYSINGST
jgi:hypothetical protein